MSGPFSSSPKKHHIALGAHSRQALVQQAPRRSQARWIVQTSLSTADPAFLSSAKTCTAVHVWAVDSIYFVCGNDMLTHIPVEQAGTLKLHDIVLQQVNNLGYQLLSCGFTHRLQASNAAICFSALRCSDDLDVHAMMYLKSYWGGAG